MNEDFINRKYETQYIKELIKQRNKVNIIFSTKGTGKTCLIDHVLSNDSQGIYVNVDTNELLTKPTPEFYFIRQVVNCINEQLNLQSASQTVLSQALHKYLSNVSVSFNLGVVGVGYTVPQTYKKAVDALIEKLPWYDKDIYVHIENIQRIDETSLNYIIRIANETNNVLFFFECTNDKELCQNIERILQKNRIDAKILSINQLDWTHACMVLKNLNILATNSMEDDYEFLKGNIKELIFNHQYSILREISLAAEQQLILNLIKLIGSELSINEIHTVLGAYNSANRYLYSLPQLREYIGELMDLELVTEVTNDYYILTDAGYKYATEDKLDIIIAALSQYYIPIIENDDSKINDKIKGLRLLMNIFIQYNDERIYKIIPYIEPNLLFLNGNKETIDKLYRHVVNDDNNKKNPAILCIVKSYIRLECFQEAYEIINSINPNESITFIILYATILVNTKTDDKNTEKYILEHIKTSSNSVLISALYTCLMSLYMKIKSTDYVVSFVNSLDLSLLTKTDYHILYKNFSIYLNNKTAFTTLGDCLKYFQKNNLNSLTIATSITLATRYAQSGLVEKSRKLLYEIINNDFLRIQDFTYVENNLSVLDIIENQYNDKTIKKLKAAYCFCKDEYTHLLIANNILIYYTQKNQLDEALLYAQEIEDVGFELYRFDDYLHLAYLNLRYYYSKADNKQKVEIYNVQLRILQKKCHSDELRAYIGVALSDTNILDESDRWFYMSKLKYRPAFLGHWIVNFFDC